MSHLSRLFRRWPRLLVTAAVVVGLVPLVGAPAHAATDITEQVRRGDDVTLEGDSVVVLVDGEEITSGGVLSGTGTLTVRGTGKLVLTEDSDFQIPEDRRRQRLEVHGVRNHPYAAVHDPDPPAVTVEAGATLQYGDGSGGSGRVGHYPYDYPDFAWNALNHHIDGTLIVAVSGAPYHPGILSGDGVLNQPRFVWDGVSLAGDHSFSGTVVNGTGVHASMREQYRTSLDNLDKLVNYGSFQIDTPHDYDTVLDFDVFSREWGNDINFYGAPDGSRVVMTGVYSWTDEGTENDPHLSDPGLNWRPVPKNINKRGVNIQGAIVQWGDGTHNRFFLPGTRETIYINLYTRRARGHLIFDYNGPVTLGAPISGGRYHDTMDAVATGDVTIAGTPGNDVTFADQQNYDGTTTIGAGATLRLGTGEPEQDSWLITGTDTAQVVNDGALVVQNADKDVELSQITGGGSLDQAGSAALTLTGQIAYTGPTTVSGGELVLAGADLASSARVELSAPGAVLDVAAASDGGVRNLSGVAKSTLHLGTAELTVENTEDTKYAGRVEGAGDLVKTGGKTLEYSGTSAAEGPWKVAGGTLSLSGAELAGDLDVTEKLFVTGKNTVGGDLLLGQESTLRLDTGAGLDVAGGVTLDGGTLEIRHDGDAATPEELTVVTAEGRITGTYAGLDEGSPVDVGGRTYEIAYEEHRVVLVSPAPETSPSPEPTPLAAAPRTDETGPSPTVAVVASLTALVALALAAAAILFRTRWQALGPVARHVRRSRRNASPSAP